MSDKLLYYCRGCGVECDSHPIEELPNGEVVAKQAICHDCCEDHDYEYDRDRRGRFCKHCDHQQPAEEYDYEV